MKTHLHRPVASSRKHLHVDVRSHWHVKGTPGNRLHEVWVQEEGHVDRVVAGPSYRSGGRGVVVVADVA